jgi:phage-related protein
MATELGSAYVQIVPSMQGISGSISKLMSGESASAGMEAGSNFGSSFKAKAIALIAGLGIGKLLKDSISASISEGAALQQSLGGVETLFKSSADTVKNYANEAYRTTGLSANKYMESVTGFSASLLQSLGGDTGKAAEVANMAMVDMSDNANKMGTSMESIQFAYQGFAKQNYTMLDNLKLGYGGTKQEMQRLLADAEKLTGVKYDINNLSDVYSAIHAIQGKLDITGTTAKEAATTFTGSFESMKAAAQNVLGKLALGEDIKPALEALYQTTSTFLLDNFFPMIGNIVSQSLSLIASGIKGSFTNIFGEGLGDIMLGMVTSLSSAVVAFKAFSTVTDFMTGIPAMLTTIKGAVTALFATLSANPIGLVIAAVAALTAGLVYFFTQTESGRQMWQSFMDWFTQAWQSIAPILTEAWNGVVETAVEVWNNMIAFVSPIIQSVVDFIKVIWNDISSWWTENQSLIQQTFETVWNAIQAFIQAVMPIIQSIIQTAMNILAPFIELTWKNIGVVVTTVWELMKNSIQTSINVIQGIIKAVMQIINGDWSGAWETIKGIGETIWNGMVNAGRIIFHGFAQALANVWSFIQTTASNAWEFLKSMVLSIIANIVSGAQSAWDSMINSVSNLVSIVTGIFNGLWNIDLVGAGRAIMDGFLNGLKSAWGAVTDFVGGIASWIANHKGPIEYDRKLLIPAGKAIMESLDEGLTNKFETVKDTVSGMASEINDVFNNDINDFDMGATVSKDFKIEDMSTTDVALNNNNVEVINALEFVQELLKGILAKDNNTYLDGEVLAKNSYDRQMSFIQREGI